MKRASLSILELSLMLLVFAIAAVVCLRAYALADRLSREAEELDRAVLWAQTIAEEWKACDGNMDKGDLPCSKTGENTLRLPLDKAWAPAGEAAYEVVLEEENGLLPTARITVREAESGREIYGLTVARQEAA